MQSNDIDSLIAQSVHALDIGLQIYEAGEHVVWMSITTELFRLLIDRQSGPLATYLTPALTLHPLKSNLGSSRLEWIFASPGFTSSNGSFAFNLFDGDKPPLGLDEWLDQVVAVSAKQSLTLRDAIKWMRHKRTAHTEGKRLGGKPRAIISFGTLSLLGESHAAFERILVDVGHQVLQRIRATARIPLITASTPIISRKNILRAIEKHRTGKARLDTVVSGELSDPLSECTEATRELKEAVILLDLQSLAGLRLEMMAHLAEALRFSAILTGDKQQILRSLAILQYSIMIAESTDDRSNYLSTLHNLAIFYEQAAKYLHRRLMLRLSLETHQLLIDTNCSAIKPSFCPVALEGAARVSLKLFRFWSYFRYKKQLEELRSNESNVLPQA